MDANKRECKFRYLCSSVVKKRKSKAPPKRQPESIITGVPLAPYSLRRKRKEPRMNSDGRGLKRSPGSPSLPHRILFRRFKVVVFSEECVYPCPSVVKLLPPSSEKNLHWMAFLICKTYSPWRVRDNHQQIDLYALVARHISEDNDRRRK